MRIHVIRQEIGSPVFASFSIELRIMETEDKTVSLTRSIVFCRGDLLMWKRRSVMSPQWRMIWILKWILLLMDLMNRMMR